MQKIKLHARVTKEIEITAEQITELVNYIRTGNGNIESIRNMFTDGIKSGNYEKGYIPSNWLEADLDIDVCDDIDL